MQLITFNVSCVICSDRAHSFDMAHDLVATQPTTSCVDTFSEKTGSSLHQRLSEDCKLISELKNKFMYVPFTIKLLLKSVLQEAEE